MYNQINQELRAIFSDNMYDLDREKVNLIMAKLDSLGWPHYSRIKLNLRLLGPADNLLLAKQIFR